jgi:Chlorophyll A-B binding protein
MKLHHLCTVASTTTSVAAFTPVTRSSAKSRPFVLASTVLDNESNNSVDRPSITTARKKRVMSQAIPFLECPAMLAESNLAGNAGFDPLGFVQNQEDLFMYREAEIKHARLAMLVGVVIKVAAVNDLFFITRCSHVRNFLSQAAAGWPLSELFDRQIAESLGLPPMLDAGDSVPAMLNDSLNSISPVFWGSCLGMSAAIDFYGTSKAREGDPSYIPGNLGFDPLGLYPLDKERRARIELVEIKHGRLAMIAVAGFAFQEFATKLGVVDETPFYFHPAGSVL